MAGGKLPDFFISRAGASPDDLAISERVRDILLGANYSVVLQQFDFANRNFMQMMDQSLASGARIISILSQDYLASEHCEAEWYHPLTNDPLNKKSRLIVLRVKECAPQGLLKGIAYWDLAPLRDNKVLFDQLVLAAVDRERHARLPLNLAELWQPPGAVIDDRNTIRPVPGFTGRGDALADIDAALSANETAALFQSAAVHGLGGVGKSAIARQYAWTVAQYPDVYAGIWWLDAESTKLAGQTAASWPGIEAGLIALGTIFIRQLAAATDRAEAARHALRFLNTAGFTKPWLLIYDNLDDKGALDAWPPPRNAHVIVTSRIAKWANDGMAPISVDKWPRDDSVRFLSEASKRADLTADDAGAIADALGDLPLALTQSAAYLADNDAATPASYLAAISHHMAEVPDGAARQAPRAVFATLRQNIAEAEARTPGCGAILSLAALFAADDIPLELFEQQADIYPPALAAVLGGGPVGLEKALGALGQLSLLDTRRETRTFSVHRLVQAAARETEPGGAALWVAAGVAAINAAYPGEEFKHWPAFERLLPHARVVAQIAPDNLGAPLALLLNRTGYYLNERAAYELAEPLYKRSLAIRETALGPDHPDVGTSLNNLAALYREQGKYELAEPLFQRSLAIRETALAQDHPDVGTSLNNLALLYVEQGKFDLAEPFYKRSLAIAETALGPDHPNTAITLKNLARLFKATGRPGEALPLARRAHSVFVRALGAEHPNTKTAAQRLAAIEAELAG